MLRKYSIIIYDSRGWVVMRNRNSSFELMRIVSMIFIVIGHTLSWGGVTDSANDFLKLIIYIMH